MVIGSYYLTNPGLHDHRPGEGRERSEGAEEPARRRPNEELDKIYENAPALLDVRRGGDGAGPGAGARSTTPVWYWFAGAEIDEGEEVGRWLRTDRGPRALQLHHPRRSSGS